MKQSSQEIANMENKYRRAQALMQGCWTRTIVANSTLYPIWIEGSECFWYEREINLHKNAGHPDQPLSKWDREYRLVNATVSTNNLAFDHEVLAAALAEAAQQDIDKNQLPITHVQMTLDTADQIKTVAFEAFGKSWGFEPTSGALIATSEKTSLRKQLVSPDGKFALFIQNDNLWLQDLNTKEERPLTQDGEEHYCYAVSGNGWGYDMGGDIEASWSPDSKRVFTVQRDSRQVLTVPIVEHVPQEGSIRPKVNHIKLAMQGDEHIPDYRLVSIDIESGRLQAAHYPKVPITRNSFGFFSSSLGWWSTDNQHAYFVDVARDYQRVSVVELDATTGNTRTLFEETSDTHINLMLNADDYPAIFPLPETNELIWFSERSGWAHLYLYDLTTGALKNPITAGEWVVRDILAVDLERRELFIQTAGREESKDPYYRDLARVHLDTGELTTVLSGDYDCATFPAIHPDMNTFYAQALDGRDIGSARSISHSGNFAVVTHSRADTVPISVLVNREGQELLTLETGDLSALHARVSENWQWPEPVKMLAADGKTDIYGLIYRPSDFSPDHSYPVISETFNTPELPYVPKGSFSNAVAYGKSYLDAAAWAELGFIVVQIDGRGTPFRSKEFQDISYGWAESSSSLEDHVAGIQQLAQRYSYMDLERVGIISLMGGTGAVQGLLQYPDFYQVGANGMMHDSRLMPTSMWSDKYEGLAGPGAQYQYPEAYADKLQGKLLMVGGMLDTTCTPSNTFRMVEAFQKANKDFDLMLLPNLGHANSGYLTRRAWDYMVDHLLNTKPYKEFLLSTSEDLIEG